MARAKPVLACLLLSCLAAAALATPQQGRVSRIQKGILANPQAVKGTSANPQAVYDCPDTPRMKGCAATGCALHMYGKSSTLVCAQCASNKAYTLVNENTRKAQCGECHSNRASATDVCKHLGACCCISAAAASLTAAAVTAHIVCHCCAVKPLQHLLHIVAHSGSPACTICHCLSLTSCQSAEHCV